MRCDQVADSDGTSPDLSSVVSSGIPIWYRLMNFSLPMKSPSSSSTLNATMTNPLLTGSAAIASVNVAACGSSTIKNGSLVKSTVMMFASLLQFAVLLIFCIRRVRLYLVINLCSPLVKGRQRVGLVYAAKVFVRLVATAVGYGGSTIKLVPKRSPLLRET